MKTPLWIGTEPPRSLELKRADDGSCYSKTLLAYWGVCLKHALLIEKLMGEALVCPECPEGTYHNGKLAMVTFHSAHPGLIFSAIDRVMRIDPALYEGKHEFDLCFPGETIVRYKDQEK